MNLPSSRFGSPEQVPRSLYVHFPFCVHRCHYCDFSVSRSSDPPVDAWLDAIARELEGWFEHEGWSGPAPLDTLFVGGGTPSLLGAGGIEKLRGIVERWFRIDPSRSFEWTVEANPASFDRSLGRAWADAGVTRISLGVQSFQDDVLRWLGRLHDAAGARRAIEAALACGVTDVNADLMFGLPEDVPRDVRLDLDAMVASGAGHVSLYGLTVEPRTPLARWMDLGRVSRPTEERYELEFRLAHEVLADAGFTHYEVSNFARDGRESRHNWQYWLGAPYLGLGPSAHGFLPPYRVWNVFRWPAYRAAVAQGGRAIEGYEELSERDVALEELWLGLRTRRGIGLEAAREDRNLERFETAGWLVRTDGRWVATVEGWLRMDELVARIGAVPARAVPEAGLPAGG